MRGMTAPIFFTVTGLVFTFLLLRDGRPIKENERIRKGIRRGFFLIFLGYLLKVNFPAFLIGWFYKSYPALDVLHNIGFALLALIGLYCLHLITKISLPLLYFGGGIFIFLINPTWLAFNWDFLPIVLRNYFDADNGSLFLPVPWLGFTLLGAGLGWHLFHKTYLYRTWYWPAILLTAGLTIHFFSTKGLLLLHQWTGWENFIKLAYDNVLFWRFGHVLIIISLFIFLEKIITFPPLMLKIGSETLTIYATHYVVLYGTWLGIGIKTFGQFTWHLFVLCQFAFQFGAGMLALAQKPQGAAFERRLKRRLVQAHSPLGAAIADSSTRMPSDSRTLFSISRAKAGFSRKNSRALSRPWPIFSPW